MNIQIPDILDLLGEIPGVTAESARVILGTVIAAALPAMLIGLAMLVLQIAARWKMLEAAGEPGWKSIIPFYGEYTMDKVTWSKVIFWVKLILSVSVVLLFSISIGLLVVVVSQSITVSSLSVDAVYKQLSRAIGKNLGAGLTAIIILLVAEVIIMVLSVIRIVSYWHVSKAYNHGIGYFFGFLFFPSYFWLILGFDSGLKYCGNAEQRKNGGITATEPKAPAAPERISDPVTPTAPFTPTAPVVAAAPEYTAKQEVSAPETPVTIETSETPAAPSEEETAAAPEIPADPAAEEKPTVCSACGAPLAPGANFCTTCGTPIQKG